MQPGVIDPGLLPQNSGILQPGFRYSARAYLDTEVQLANIVVLQDLDQRMSDEHHVVTNDAACVSNWMWNLDPLRDTKKGLSLDSTLPWYRPQTHFPKTMPLCLAKDQLQLGPESMT